MLQVFIKPENTKLQILCGVWIGSDGIPWSNLGNYTFSSTDQGMEKKVGIACPA
jgi:hypothetical protein